MIIHEWNLIEDVLNDIRQVIEQDIKQEAKAKAAAKAKEKTKYKCKEMGVEELEKVLDQVRNRPITDELEKIIAQIKEVKSVKTEDTKTEGIKKEEKVSLSKDKEMPYPDKELLYPVKFTETELRALYRLLLNGVCTVRSKNLYEGLHTASEKIYKVYVNNFCGGHE